MRLSRRSVLALPAVLSLPAIADAANPVRIGVISPLSGNSAAEGHAIKQGVEAIVDIINGEHPEFAPMPLAKSRGLPRLGGAKIEVKWADNQGKPSVGETDAVRLITQDHVAALSGAYESNITLTASAVAERYGIPYLTGDSVAPVLTQRGFKWFFRTTPYGPDFGKLYFDFLDHVAQSGMSVSKVSIVHENSVYGKSITGSIEKVAKSRGKTISQKISYNSNTTDVSSEVLQLKRAKPDVVIFVSYTSDAILFIKEFHSQGYRPPIVIGDDSGFSDPSFIKTVGKLAQGALDRDSFVVGPSGSLSSKINEFYKKRTGRDLDGSSAREMQGFLVLCDAINRAGSTKPNAIREALVKTDMSAKELFTAYKGIKFNSDGQNTLAYSVMIQLQGESYVPVWPSKEATGKLELPFKGWT